MKKEGLLQYLRNWRFNSLLIRNFLLIALGILLCVGLMTIPGYYQVQRAVRDEAGQAYTGALLRQMDQVRMTIDNARMAMMQLSISDDVGIWLRPGTQASISYESIMRMNRIINQLSGYAAVLMPAVTNFLLYAPGTDRVLSGAYGGIGYADYPDQGWYEEYQRYLADSSHSMALRSITQYERERKVLTLLQAAPIITRGEQRGVVVVDMDLSRLFYGSGTSAGSHLIVTDAEGTIIAYNDMALYGQPIETLALPEDAVGVEDARIIRHQGRSMMLTVRYDAGFEWWYYAVDALDQYDARLQQTLRAAWTVAGLMGLLGLAYALFVSLQMFRPVRNILHALESHNVYRMLPMEAREESKNEIAFLSKMILSTLDRNQALTDTLAERLQSLNQARLLMLQSQINPHFLYNTLDSINWMSMDILGGENEVSDALCSLSELLRASLQSGSVVPLNQEVYRATLYIKLQQLRFGNRLVVQWQLSEDTLSDTAPAMVLQPLIENSIKHGKEASGAMHITVHADHDGDTLVLRVVDEGPGMSADALARLRAQLTDKSVLAQEHVGLINVQQRLRMLYGDRAGIRVANGVMGRGLEVKIVIPKVK